MLVRLFIPAFAWISMMLLFFLREYSIQPEWNFSGFTPNGVAQAFLFLGSTHIWLGIFKKQLRYDFIRDNAYKIVIALGLFFMVIMESMRYFYSFTDVFNWWHIFCDMLGIFLGIGTFRLLYRGCC
jgi:hypothetical protein